MSQAKKIISQIIEGGVEALKDSAEQIANTVSPDVLLKQALGEQGKKTDELTTYLKNLGPDITPEELEKKKAEFGERDEKEMEDAQKILHAAIPAHMRLQQGKRQPGPYELSIQEEERKKAMAVEAQKKQSQSMPAPTSRQSPGMPGKKKRPQSNAFETSKNIKVG